MLSRIFKKKLKTHLVEGKYKVVPAFTINGTTYYMFENTNEQPTGRMLASMAIYEELSMRCDREYLELHVKAMDKIINNPKGINITYIAQLNVNLKERLELAPLPDYVYKLASVLFFDETESMYGYDFDYNKKKIKKWKDSGETLDFFLKILSKDLIPSLRGAVGVSKTYFRVAEQINEIHHEQATRLSSES